MRHALAAALLAFSSGAASAAAGAQTTTTPVVVRDAGPGLPGRLLRAILAAPHETIFADSSRRDVSRMDTTFIPAPTVHLKRDSTPHGTVVVLGGSATVERSVHGDMVVVGGDLFVRPGAVIDGRAIAIGGGVYVSTLATIRGATLSFRDETFDVHREGGRVFLDYRSLGLTHPPLIDWPLMIGLRLPSYDRVDGLELPIGPVVTLDTGKYTIEPIVTYRSHLGAFDPSVSAMANVSRRLRAEADAGRYTLSNDRWIRTDLINSGSAALSGVDTRNYYRADRASARLSQLYEGVASNVRLSVGALSERAWSTGPDSHTRRAPYSVFNRRDREKGMLRYNPRVERGVISSGTLGASGDWRSADGITSSASAQYEAPVQAPNGRHFTQLTLDGQLMFPTFGVQRFEFFTHGVATTGSAPPQRYAYLGGSGTILTMDLLSMGGDQLFYAESHYVIPLEHFPLPFLGPPELTLRHQIGGAGVGRLPTLVQNVGFRIAVSYLRIDYAIDPASRKSEFGVSLSVSR